MGQRKAVGMALAVVVSLLMIAPMFSIARYNEGTGIGAATTETIICYRKGLSTEYSLSTQGAKVLASYDSFVYAEATGAQFSALKADGMDVFPVLDAREIHRGAYVWDTRFGEPDVPADLRSDTTAAERLYLVQFVGPTKGEWLDDMSAVGADIYYYMPNYAYVARMSGSVASTVTALPFVAWVGDYHPAYKLSPDIVSGRMMVDVMNGPNALATVGELSKLGTIVNYSYDESFDQYTVCIDALASSAEAMARLPDVIWVESYGEPMLYDETSSEIVGGIWTANTPYGGHGNYANLAGWNGTNVVVAVADTGLSSGVAGNAGHVDFNTNRVIGGKGYGTITTWADGHGHGTHVSGIVAANGWDGTGVHYASTTYHPGAGVAPNAKLYAQKIFTDAGSGAGIPTTAAGWDTLFQDVYNNGCYVQTNSWGGGNNGAYAANDRYYDLHVRDTAASTSGAQPLIITVAAGNAGSAANTIGSPGNGKNVITIGASENYHPDASTYGDTGDTIPADANDPNQIISFSSRGWCDDNRIKPDVAAPGTAILSTHSSIMATSGLYGFYTPDHRYEWCSGTSQANPHVAGAAAVITQWYNTTFGARPMPAMVKALLINSAIDMGTADIPNQNEGWGRAYLPTIVNPPVNVIRQDATQLLATGNTYSQQVIYDVNTGPMKFTLVYTDPAAAAGATVALINNINLRITAPGGQIWYGNAFSGGMSVANTRPNAIWDTSGDNFDDRNNIENVYIPTAQLQSGAYTVEVIAQAVGTDAVPSTPAVDQDFALVMYNARPYVPATKWFNATVNATGWNLVSIPLRNTAGAPLNWLFADQANGGAGLVTWDRMMWYEPRTPTNIWKQYNKNWNVALNDLTAYNTTRGVWLNITSLGDGLICKGGANFTNDASTSIPLKAGWNLVGFPSSSTTYTVANLKAAVTTADIVEGFMPSQTYRTTVLGNAQILRGGRAYWIHTTADAIWTVSW